MTTMTLIKNKKIKKALVGIFKNMGGNIPGGNFLVGNFPGVNSPGGTLIGGNFPGWNFCDSSLDFEKNDTSTPKNVL